MGRKKGKNIYWLVSHVIVYTFVTAILWALFLGLFEQSLITLLLFVLITFSTHFFTDYFTSKLSGLCYLRMLDKTNDVKKRNLYEWAFWSTIGFDQLIHNLTLILTYIYLY
jgi:fatty acid desaturase